MTSSVVGGVGLFIIQREWLLVEILETEHKIRVLCDLSSISQFLLVAQVCRELLLYVRHGFTSQTKPFR